LKSFGMLGCAERQRCWWLKYFGNVRLYRTAVLLW
jgi:hypothetical protein